MKFNIPDSIPAKEEFITKFVEAIFPDLQSMGFNPKPYGYMNACEKIARELNIYGGDDCECEIDMRSKVFSLMYELQKYGESILNVHNDVLENDNYRQYTSVFYTICNSSSGNLRSWLEPKTNKINISYEATLFLSYLLLSREVCVKTKKAFFEYVLSVAGITEIEEIISYKLFSLDITDVKNKEIASGSFDEIQGKGIKLFLATTYVIVYMLGKYDKDKYSDVFAKLYDCFTTTFEAEISAYESLICAENNLAECIKYFEPRSIVTTGDQLYPQDFFVVPSFENNRENPFKVIKDAKKSRRILIQAKTGLGKSSLLKMASICMLNKNLGLAENAESSLDAIAKDLDVPENNFVLFIPAKMFSFCYRKEKYKEWTKDFISLFLNTMWRLYPTYNFYDEQGVLKSSFVEERADISYKVTDELIHYLDYLASKGKLIILLDSYDEIAPGEPRDEYLEALTTLFSKYCDYPESNEVGAHVVITSREMSEDTMKQISLKLYLDDTTDLYEISDFDPAQRNELIRKWDEVKNFDASDFELLLEQVKDNHFYSEYSVNPYMLSVVCFYFGQDMKEITQNYIKTLVDKMLKVTRDAEPVIQDVLRKIIKIMQDVARETVINGNCHISRRKIDECIEKFIDKTELSTEEVDRYIEIIHEIIVVEVGLIVPADGDDTSYQFINNQIRYALAAKSFQSILEKDETAIIDRTEILPLMASIKEYVGVLIPLICDLIENVQLAEMILSDLAMCEFNSSDEDTILIQSMLDLILNRYGLNILTIDKKGVNGSKYVNRAQREILLRVLSSPSFLPSDEEKIKIKEAPTFKNNMQWISDFLKKTLD